MKFWNWKVTNAVKRELMVWLNSINTELGIEEIKWNVSKIIPGCLSFFCIITKLKKNPPFSDPLKTFQHFQHWGRRDHRSTEGHVLWMMSLLAPDEEFTQSDEQCDLKETGVADKYGKRDFI